MNLDEDEGESCWGATNREDPLNYSLMAQNSTCIAHGTTTPLPPAFCCTQPSLAFLTHCSPQLFFETSQASQVEHSTSIEQEEAMMVPSLGANESPVPKGCSAKRKRRATITVAPQQPNANPSQTFVKSSKYLHVHCFVNTGKWGAWFNDATLLKGKRRLYFGTYDTEYLAARAQDRAALKFKLDAIHPITHLNFNEADYQEDKDLREKLSHEQFRRLLMAESRSSYNKAEPSPCWRKFMTEEAAKGNLPSAVGNQSNRYKVAKTLTQVLEDLKKVEETASNDENTDDDDKSSEDEEEPVVRTTATRTKRRTSPLGNQLAGPLPKRAARSERSRPVPEPTPEPTLEPVRPVRKAAKVRPSTQSSVNLDRLVWTVTGKRSSVSVRKRSRSPRAATSDTSNEKEELGSELTVQSTRSSTRRVKIDLECEPANDSSGSVNQSPQFARGNNVMIESTLGLHATLLQLADACKQMQQELI